jgi:protein O-GlcNAc transferase
MNANARSGNKAVRKGLAHLDAGRIENAERLFRSVLKSEPNNPEANHALGTLAIQQGKLPAALAFLTAALQANPQEGRHWLSFAEALLLAGSIGDARAVLDKAAARGLSNPATTALRTRLDHAELYQHALDHHRSGRLAEAEKLYTAVLLADAAHVDSLHMIGVLASQTGRAELGIELIGQAIRLKGDVASFHRSLGSALAGRGQIEDAIKSFERALELDPEDAVAHNDLGNLYRQKDDSERAFSHYEKAIRIDPDNALAFNNIGSLLRESGNPIEAIGRYRQALAVAPDFAEAHYNLATALGDLDRSQDALAHFQRAVELRRIFPDARTSLGNLHRRLGNFDEAIKQYAAVIAAGVNTANAHNDMAAVLIDQGKPNEAIGHLVEALRQNPGLPEAHNNLGNVLNEAGRLDEAIRHYQEALRLKPGYALALSNIAGALKAQGKIAEAVESYRSAIRLKPDFVDAHNNLIMLLGYSAEVPHQALVDQARLFDDHVAAPLLRRRALANKPNPDRRLRIGYVSGDFRDHAVNYFFEPLLQHHQRHDFEFFAYANLRSEDGVTTRLKSQFDHWRDIRAISDDAAADLIEADGIDILVDLSGHMAANRLLVFARKPAPIQATWLGFTTTTGLSAIDYRITDIHADPVGMTEHLNTETLWRLPATFCCYRPRAGIPQPIDHPPRDDNGFTTFGCFNNFTKVSDRTLKRWAEILARVPDARLLLEIVGIDSPDFRRETEARLAGLGLPLDRMVLEPRRRSNQYVLYDRIDIALDPFPFNGGTTTLDALWMGVPVVTLAGEYFTARMGVTILNNAGLPELIAESETAYVDLATGLATDLSKLRAIRRNLRQKMAGSRMMDFPAFTRDIEAAYRGMWQAWCANQTTSPANSPSASV